MRVNVNCQHSYFIEVFLDGKKLTTCIEADDKEGYVWVLVGENNRGQWAALAHPGDFIWDEYIVKRATGRVEIRFQPDAPVSEEEMREDAEKYCVPIRVHQLVQ
jgi:hypothetical protein